MPDNPLCPECGSPAPRGVVATDSRARTSTIRFVCEDNGHEWTQTRPTMSDCRAAPPASPATSLEVVTPRAALPEINGLRAGCAPLSPE